ncbi:hypothetical protein LTR50_006200 [Elasticomyces elasticus]|nr:hypothetical protein LTR50_006200 [Elasticomyces elasticus]
MSQAPTAPVPKFASFRPKGADVTERDLGRPIKDKRKPPQDKQDVRASIPGDQARCVDHHSYGGTNEHNDRTHKASSSRDGGRDHRTRTTAPVKVVKPNQHSTTAGEEESRSFFIDTRGDSKNLAYGSLHQYKIPPFHRRGAGSVIGLEPGLKIDRYKSTENVFYLRDANVAAARRQERLLTAKQRLPESRRMRFVAAADSDQDLDMSRDYVLLSSTRKRKRKRESECSISDSEIQARPDYRSVERNPTFDGQPTDQDLEYTSSSMGSDEGVSFELGIRKHNAELTRRTKSDPTNLEVWLELIGHQDKMIGSSTLNLTLSKAEKHSLADIKVSIYEQALKHIMKNQKHREILTLGMIEEASVVWETRKLKQKWKDILREYPSSIDLWTKYLDFAQSNPLEFRYDRCKSVYFDCLDTLACARRETNGREINDSIQEVQLYVLLRLAVYVRDSGYEELAVALWQAMLEFYLFRPPNLDNASKQLLLDSFEQFWDSEVPRLGENGASGWRQYDKVGGTAPTGRQVNADKRIDPAFCFRDFVEAEEQYSHELCLPGRTADTVTPDDPYHIVLYSDIRSILERVPERMNKSSLISAYLCFHSLPAPSCSGRNDCRWWWTDAFLRCDRVKIPQKLDRTDINETMMLNYPTSTETLFSSNLPTSSGFGLTNQWAGRPASQTNFIRHTLKALVAACPEQDGLAEYFLAYEFCNFPDDAVKSARILLKQRPSSLHLYNAYAQIEANLGHNDRSDQVFRTAISMAKELPEGARGDVVLLWRTWVWNVLRRDGLATAKTLMLSMGHPNVACKTFEGTDEPTNLSSLLRVRRDVSESFHNMLVMGASKLAVLYAELLALLAYTTHDGCIEYAIEEFNDMSSSLIQRLGVANIAVELLHQAKAQLLAFHTRGRHLYVPRLIRSELTKSVELFPDNTIFLSLYAEDEARFRIDDRVRAIIKDNVLNNNRTTVIGWSFAIREEIARARGQTSGSTTHSVRSTFRRALTDQSSPACHNQTLWRGWFEYELSLAPSSSAGHTSDLRKGKTAEKVAVAQAKQVLLDGLRYLPWVKSWVMMGLHYFTDGGRMSFDELKQLYYVLGERELRVREQSMDAAVEEAQALEDEMHAEEKRRLQMEQSD